MAIFDKLNITGLADSAAALYDDIEFNTSSFYNKPPPHPNVSFIIGGVLSFLSLVYWFVLRWLPTQRLLKRDVANPSWQLSLRTLISTLSDNDDPAYTCLRLTSQAMLLLGGYQLDYRKTFMFMIFYYTALSFSESMRVVLSLAEHQNLGDLVLVNKREKAATRTALKDRSEGLSKISLVATNVYEDLSRNMWIVTMVFITQATLISLVCIVIYRTDFMSTLDGTPDVPTVGTLGSWLIYCLGIFMQANYVLGPSSNFGSSEQNPIFWIQLFVGCEGNGAHCSWIDSIYDEERTIGIRPSSFRLWIRYTMSFLINGVGFHLLIHALPIQVAGQSSLLGIVFRAVGMLYLVDLDDAGGTILTISEAKDVEEVKEHQENELQKTIEEITGGATPSLSTHSGGDGDDPSMSSNENEDPSVRAQRMIAEAEEKADAIQRKLRHELEVLMRNYVISGPTGDGGV